MKKTMEEKVKTSIPIPPTITIAYFEEVCYEFSRLLYDLSEENHRLYGELEQRCMILEEQCHKYEKELAKSGNLKIALIVFLRKFCLRTRRFCIDVVRKIFASFRKFATEFGIKQHLKKTWFFKYLENNGILEKLRK